MTEQIARASDTENTDASEVRTKMNNLTIFKKVKKDPKLDTTNNVIDELLENKKSPLDLPICLVTSFMMCKGAATDKSEIKGLEQDRESIKAWVNFNKEKVQEEKSNRQGGNQQNHQEQEEAPSTPATPQTPIVPDTTPQQPVQNSETQQEQGQQPQEQNQNDNFEEITTFFEQLCQFTLWFVSFEKIKDNKKYEADFKKYIQSGTYDNVLMKMFKSGEISPQTIEPHVKELASLFQNDGKQGLFVLRWTPQSQTELKDDLKDLKRQTYYFEELKYVPYSKTNSSTPEFDKLEQEVEDRDEDTDNSDDEQSKESNDNQDSKLIDQDFSDNVEDEEDEENEEDFWISNKIRLLKQKGII